MCIGWLRVRAVCALRRSLDLAIGCVVCVSSVAMSLRMVCGGWVPACNVSWLEVDYM
jgi:hypothetical protein